MVWALQQPHTTKYCKEESYDNDFEQQVPHELKNIEVDNSRGLYDHIIEKPVTYDHDEINEWLYGQKSFLRNLRVVYVKYMILWY